eukprot:TRINITY_DN41342_c0_g1_i1.p1 TRINITY_DN41342_c0_g1~~TRINITY_DN41342_c0_g1_i1.p1  ORF type:complete len:119 (-),score=45.75 TRINITY_DN41342_c0_g1_i1:30-386(-)
MGIYNMDQNNQLAANANFGGTNNSSRGFDQFNSAGVPGHNSTGGQGSGGSGVNGFMSGSGVFQTSSSSAGMSAGVGSRLGGAAGGMIADQVGGSAAGAVMAGMGRALRDFNVWMPQSM